MGEVTLRAEGLVKEYAGRRGRPPVRAVRDVSLELEAGRTLGVVGESGCGKSTLARLLVGLEPPTSGSVEIEGEPVRAGSTSERRALARRIQLVFQDPFSSLDPRLTVERALGEVLKVHHLADRDGRGSRISGLLEMVALPPRFAARYPHELSGGQAQRVAIARALAVEPRILVLDEPTSALDVSVRAEVMNLLIRLQEELQLTFVFISHDLGMVRHISDEIRVMYLGRVVEAGPYDLVLDSARHPYTRALAAAVPVPDPELEEERRGAGANAAPGGPGRARGRLPLQPTLPARRGGLLLRRPTAARARPEPPGRLPRRRSRRRPHPNVTLASALPEGCHLSMSRPTRPLGRRLWMRPPQPVAPSSPPRLLVLGGGSVGSGGTVFRARAGFLRFVVVDVDAQDANPHWPGRERPRPAEPSPPADGRRGCCPTGRGPGQACVAAFDQIFTEILTVADTLSAGLVRQFPEGFAA